jgi:hypothetical protein
LPSTVEEVSPPDAGEEAGALELSVPVVAPGGELDVVVLESLEQPASTAPHTRITPHNRSVTERIIRAPFSIRCSEPHPERGIPQERSPTVAGSAAYGT